MLPYALYAIHTYTHAYTHRHTRQHTTPMMEFALLDMQRSTYAYYSAILTVAAV